MNFLDNLMGFIIDNSKSFLGAIGAIIFITIIIGQRKKITNEYVCPNCKIPTTDRISRNLLEKLIHFNINSKKFKCLKCWKIYYVIETKKTNK